MSACSTTDWSANHESTWNLYDLSDPAHPAFRSHGPRQAAADILSEHSRLFQQWHQGVLEFRMRNTSFEPLRYLSDGLEGGNLYVAVDGACVYNLTVDKERRLLSAYRQ